VRTTPSGVEVTEFNREAVKAALPPSMTADVTIAGRPELKQDSNQTPYEIGYINFTTGNFSKESKKGYTKVEYRKVIERVTLELTSEQMEQLRELGIVK